VARLLLLGPARDATGTREVVLEGDTVQAVLAEAVDRYGDALQRVLDVSRVWLNGEQAELDAPVSDYDEIAVLPPVSGGCGAFAPASSSSA